jgi:hypothetical protein
VAQMKAIDIINTSVSARLASGSVTDAFHGKELSLLSAFVPVPQHLDIT